MTQSGSGMLSDQIRSSPSPIELLNLPPPPVTVILLVVFPSGADFKLGYEFFRMDPQSEKRRQLMRA